MLTYDEFITFLNKGQVNQFLDKDTFRIFRLESGRLYYKYNNSSSLKYSIRISLTDFYDNYVENQPYYEFGVLISRRYHV